MFRRNMKKKFVIMAIAAMLGSGVGFNYSEAAPNDPMEAAISELQAEDVIDMVIIGASKINNVVAQYKNPVNRELLLRVAMGKGENEIAEALKQAFDRLSPITSFTNKDLVTTIVTSQPGAEEFKMGVAYGSGVGQRQNDLEAFYYYKKAADMGNIRAVCYLGLMYEYGKGTDKNLDTAMVCYQKAAENNNAYGQYLYGSKLVEGEGCEKNVQAGLLWLERAAAQNNVGALIKLGDIHSSNNYSIMDNQTQSMIRLYDKEKAIEYYRRARDTGKAEGQYAWGKLYDDGRLVPENDTEAVEWYQKAAEQEYYHAMNRLAYMYDFGYSVPSQGRAEKYHYWKDRKEKTRKYWIASNVNSWGE